MEDKDHNYGGVWQSNNYGEVGLLTVLAIPCCDHRENKANKGLYEQTYEWWISKIIKSPRFAIFYFYMHLFLAGSIADLSFDMPCISDQINAVYDDWGWTRESWFMYIPVSKLLGSKVQALFLPCNMIHAYLTELCTICTTTGTSVLLHRLPGTTNYHIVPRYLVAIF